MSYQQVPFDEMESTSVQAEPVPEMGANKRKTGLIVVGVIILGAIIVAVAVTFASSGSDPSVSDVVMAQKYELTAATAVCNDGSPGVYFLQQPNPENKTWIIYLEGGYLYCWDSVTCDFRWTDENSADLMSSLNLPDEKELVGLMSADCDFNPYWCEANMVFIKYCSSDLFTGNIAKDADDNDSGYHFMGYNIMVQTLNRLFEEHGLAQAEQILYSGKGGGGAGAFVTATRAQDMILAGLDDPTIPVKFFMDTGWLSDHEPYSEYQGQCEIPMLDWIFPMSCDYQGGVTQGSIIWNPSLPDYCTDAGMTWECYFTEYTIADIMAQVDHFTFMWQYDSTQLNLDGAADMTDPDQAAYAVDWATYMVNDVYIPAGFAGFVPGCHYHEIMESEVINDVIIDGVSFNEALHNWFVNGDNSFYYDPVSEVSANPTCPELNGY